MSIVWLASYPKSGNTWLRTFLTSYLKNDGTPASINELIGPLVTSRALFDEYLGLPSSDLAPGEILRLRPLLHELLAAELPRPTFFKVHDACIHTAGGPLFPRAATAGAVYLVRNPLDVAVSYAHHLQWSIDRTVEEMNRSEITSAQASQATPPSLPGFEAVLEPQRLELGGGGPAECTSCDTRTFSRIRWRHSAPSSALRASRGTARG